MADTERMNIAQYRKRVRDIAPGVKNKFGNKPCEYDGHKFDSIAEAERYKELKILQATKNIRDLELQPKFPLTLSRIGKTDWDNTTLGYYVADFSYDEFQRGKGWVHVVEDVKGGKATQTPLFNWKRKHFEFQYQTKIRITGA